MTLELRCEEVIQDDSEDYCCGDVSIIDWEFHEEEQV